MKTAYTKRNLKDNIASAAVLAASAIAIFGAIVVDSDARTPQSAEQQMETIVVTASRTDIARMDTILVTASREANIVVASN